MRPQLGRVFRVLSLEALQDGVRRRIVPVIAVVSLLSLSVIDSCTSCGMPSVSIGGEMQPIPDAAGWSGVSIVLVLGLWTVVLAGILAADHLVECFTDGTARLVLARPVSRGTFALSRLAGVLGITYVTGAVLLGTAAFLLQARQSLPPEPAFFAGLACAGSAMIVGALSMTASLSLPRTATSLLVLIFVGALSSLNLGVLAGAQLEGLLGALERLGPPLATSMAVALAPWIEPTEVPGDPIEIALRLGLWCVGSASLLVVVFRRTELRG
jgi:ABC-type transport system involved in multi-copper enzyme maturation permease subunit